MQDSESKKELPKENIEPAQALRWAINLELGQQNELQICIGPASPESERHNTTKSVSSPKSTFQFPITNSTGESFVSKLWPYLVSEP